MKTPTSMGEKKMEESTIEQPMPELRRPKRKFLCGLLAGLCIAIVAGGLVMTSVYLGSSLNKSKYKEYIAHGEDKKWTEYIYVTESIEEYEMNGTRSIYDFDRGLMTLVFPNDHELSDVCLVSSFDTSQFIDPQEVLETITDNELFLEETETTNVDLEVTDIPLNEKALSIRARSACAGKRIRMMRNKVADKLDQRHTRATRRCWLVRVTLTDGRVFYYIVCITYSK